MKSNNSHNADHEARKAEMIKRAQMAIDGRRGAVGCGHTEEVVKPATKAVSAQKKAILSGEAQRTQNAEFLGAGSRTRKVLIQTRPRNHGGRKWTDVSHPETLCGIAEMMEWVNTNGQKRNHYRIIERMETTLLSPAEMMPRHKKTRPSTR